MKWRCCLSDDVQYKTRLMTWKLDWIRSVVKNTSTSLRQLASRFSAQHAQVCCCFHGCSVRLKHFLFLKKKIVILNGFCSLTTMFSFLPARRYASAIFAVIALYVHLSVCLSHAVSVPKRLNVGSRKKTPHDSSGTLVFYDAKDLYKRLMESPQRDRQMHME